jgi:hypothetical protein
MNPITLIKLSILCLVASVAFHSAEAFEVRNEAEFKKIFPENAKVTKLADGFGLKRKGAGVEFPVEAILIH